ncbi:hypothetical protein EV424DRAFT_1347516 [Suillus variegatus]|nr:hypothetical protein EV424DRAFT_1347495 [Suillus variegatus]KAG1818944.1 hypothetical protein EV424DRAFT_1347516 [Suillus variegatus]
MHTDSQGLDIVKYTVPPGPLGCSNKFLVPGWEPLTHPEGALFFYHSNHRVFTYVDPKTAVGMDDVVAKKACEVAHDFPSYVELVLERMKDEKWGYCLADHDKRVIFWLEPYESKELIGNIRGVKATSLIILITLLPEYALEAQHWFVWLQRSMTPKDPTEAKKNIRRTMATDHRQSVKISNSGEDTHPWISPLLRQIVTNTPYAYLVGRGSPYQFQHRAQTHPSAA